MFEYVKNDTGGGFPVTKELKATEGSYEVGDALALDAETGLLKIAAGTVKPQYISAAKKTVTAEDAILAVNPVYEGQEWKAKFAVDGSAVKVGSKVTIDTTGRQVTATTTGGVFLVTENLGTEAVGKFM